MKQAMSKKITWNEWKGTASCTCMYIENGNKHNSRENTTQKQWKNE
jgi:hypothetical protein